MSVPDLNLELLLDLLAGTAFGVTGTGHEIYSFSLRRYDFETSHSRGD
jgi:hypothetical protein